LEHYKSFEKAAEAAQAKLTKLQRDLMQVQNEKMASERLTTKNLEQLRMKLAEKEEELEELRFGGANTEQDDAEKVELEKKLKEKEMQMKAIMDKLAGVEAKLDGKVQEIQVEISTSQSRARSRSVTPRSSDVSTQLSEVIELRRVNASLQSEIERLQSNPLASSSTKPPKPKEDLTDQLRLKSQALDAMEIEVSDTQEALEDSRQDLRRCKAELQMFKGEMAVCISLTLVTSCFQHSPVTRLGIYAPTRLLRSRTGAEEARSPQTPSSTSCHACVST
jgi:chromosome segregation ATPase